MAEEENAVSWEEVQSNPAFQSLDATQRYNHQLDYFDIRVVPRLQAHANENDMLLDDNAVKDQFKEFFTKYPAPEGYTPEYFPVRLKKLMKMQKKQISDLDVDREIGVTHLPFNINYERAKNNDERKAVFEKYGLGEQDVKPMRTGGHAINPSGMEKLGLQHHGVPTSIETSPGTGLFDPNFMAKATVEGPKIAAEVAAGMRGSRFGLAGSALRNFLVGGGVEGADEYLKHLQGLQKREPGDIKWDMFKRGGFAAGGDTAVRAAQPLARKLALGPQVSKGRVRDMWGFKKLGEHETPLDMADPTIGRRMTPDAVKRTEGALDAGMRPMISRAGESSTFPITKVVGGGQEVINRLLGDPNLFYNTGRAQALADALTSKSLGSTTQKIGEGTFGKKLARTAGQFGTKQNKTINQYLLSADRMVNQNVKNLEKSYPLGDWDYENLSTSIRTHKQDFSSKMTEKAKFLTQKNANEKNIPTQPIKDMIQEWVDMFPDKMLVKDPKVGPTPVWDYVEGAVPQGASPEIVGKTWMSPEMKHYFSEAMKMDETMSFSQLHNLRTMFSGAAWDDGLLKTVDKHRAGQMKNLLDGLADNAPNLSKKLKQFNAEYKNGMDKYDDSLILSLAKHGKNRVPLNKITDRLVDMDYVTAGKLKNILPKDDWQNMGSNIFRDITTRSRNSATNNIEPSLILDSIKKLKDNGTFYKIYPGKRGAGIVKSLKELESRGYEGDLTKLLQRDTDVSRVLQKAYREQKLLDDYMNENFMKVLTGKEPEKAMNWAMHNDARAKEMMEYLADKPELQDQARYLVMKRGLGKMTSTQKGHAAPVLDGEALSGFIDKYNSMPDNPVKTILGKELWGDLDSLSQTFKLTEYKAGGAMGAAAIGMQLLVYPIKYLPKVLRFGILSRILSNPSFTRYMTTGLKKGVGGQFGVGRRKGLGAFFRTLAQGVTSAAQKEGYTPPEEELDLKDSEVFQELMK